MSINLSSVYFTNSINIVSASFVLSLNDLWNKDVTLWGYSFSSQLGTHVTCIRRRWWVLIYSANTILRLVFRVMVDTTNIQYRTYMDEIQAQCYHSSINTCTLFAALINTEFFYIICCREPLILVILISFWDTYYLLFTSISSHTES